MMKFDEKARYAKTHEWARKEGDLFVIGLTDYAQSLLKDIVFVELPAEGTSFKKGDKVCDIESVKAVEELKTPISGEIVEINEELEDASEPINEDPYGEGWFLKIKPTNPEEFDELLTPEEYEEFLEEED
jgi:glycine cleavage system H protein